MDSGEPSYQDVSDQEPEWDPSTIVNLFKQGASPAEIILALDAPHSTVYRSINWYKSRLHEIRERVKNGETRFKGRPDNKNKPDAASKDRDANPDEAGLSKPKSYRERRALRARRYTYGSGGDRAGYPGPPIPGPNRPGPTN